MSDLQCAVTVLVFAAYDADAERALALGTSLADRRVAAVWCTDDAATRPTAEAVASVLGLPVQVREIGDVAEVLAEIADSYRGETVLMVISAAAMGSRLPTLASNLRPTVVCDHPLAEGATVELAGDADGWVCRSWAGHELARSDA